MWTYIQIYEYSGIKQHVFWGVVTVMSHIQCNVLRSAIWNYRGWEGRKKIVGQQVFMLFCHQCKKGSNKGSILYVPVIKLVIFTFQKLYRRPFWFILIVRRIKFQENFTDNRLLPGIHRAFGSIETKYSCFYSNLSILTMKWKFQCSIPLKFPQKIYI